MLKREGKGGAAIGIVGNRYLQDYPERFESPPIRPRGRTLKGSFEPSEFGLYTGSVHVDLGFPGHSQSLVTNSDIVESKAKLAGNHTALFFGAGTSLRPTRLSDLVEHLIPSIMRAIETSRHILDIKDDWDAEGSVGYGEPVWERATEFLKRNAFALRIHQDKEIEAPRILPGPEGSVDLHWKTGTHELLINIPAEPGEPADFYGDSGSNNTIKGKLDTSAQNEWILMWLTS